MTQYKNKIELDKARKRHNMQYKDKELLNKPLNRHNLRLAFNSGFTVSELEQAFNIEIDTSKMSLSDQSGFFNNLEQIDSTTWG